MRYGINLSKRLLEAFFQNQYLSGNHFHYSFVSHEALRNAVKIEDFGNSIVFSL